MVDHLGEASKKWSSALDWTLLGSRDNTAMGHLDSFLARREGGEQHSHWPGKGNVWSFLWLGRCSCFYSLLKHDYGGLFYCLDSFCLMAGVL